MNIFHVTGNITMLSHPAVRRILISYAMSESIILRTCEQNKQKDIFLDSGAFSVYTGKAKIELAAYCDFLHKHKHKFAVYAALDVISSGDQSLKNYLYMKNVEKLNPLPCWHAGEEISLLHEYFKLSDYVGIGGLVALSSRRSLRYDFLDQVFSAATKGGKVHKLHLYGLGEYNILLKYPAYSCDSKSAIMAIATGSFLKIDKLLCIKKHPMRSANLDLRFRKTFETMWKFETMVTAIWAKRGIEWKN